MNPTTSNLDNIQSKIKKMVISMGVLLGLGLIALVILLINKSNKTTSNDSTVIVQQKSVQYNLNFDKHCAPIIVTYKDNYIALSSKKCSTIKTITPTGKVNTFNY